MVHNESQKYSLKRFGATVTALLAEHGITTRQRLVELLKEEGYVNGNGQPLYSHARIGNWFYGRHETDRHFCLALIDVLELGKKDTDRLSEAFLFGQDEEVEISKAS